MLTSAGREKIITKVDYATGQPYEEKTGFTLFHVVFSGCKRDNCTEDFLFTYDGNKAPMLDWAIQHGWTGRRFMDSGMYPYWKKGLQMDVPKYLNYVNQVGDYLDAIVQVDHIPTESDGDDYLYYAQEKTWEQYCEQREQLRPELRDKFIYVMHGSDLDFLVKRATEYRDSLGMPIRFLATSLAVNINSEQRKSIGAQLNEAIKKYGYDGRLHLLGVQTPSVLQGIPVATSADSSSAVREQASGILYYKGNKIKLARDSSMHHKNEFTDAQFNTIEPELKARAEQLGIDYELARVNALERYLWNCKERSAHIQEQLQDPNCVEFKNQFSRGLLGRVKNIQER